MGKLESFLYNQIKDKSDDITIEYIKTFGTLSESSHQINERKGALFGYISIVNVIKKLKDEKDEELQHAKLLDELMKCILISLKDNDNKIVVSAAQCMYNIIHNFKSYILINFKDFFDGLLILVTIDDPEVKEITNSLDNLLKSMINYSFQGDLPEDFNLLDLFKKIISNIKLENPAIKYMIVSWINTINQIPGIKLINILNMFLDELFDMLQIISKNVRVIANECLDDFYKEIKNDFEDISYDIKVKIFEIIIQKCEKNKQDEKRVKFKAYKWANLFLEQYKILLTNILESEKSKNSININSESDTNNNDTKANSNIINTNSEENIINTNSEENIIKDNEEKNEIKTEKEEKESKEDTNEINENTISNEEDDIKKFPFTLFTNLLKIIFNTLKEVKDLKDLKETKETTKQNEENALDLYTLINNCNNCLLAIIEKYNMNENNKKQLEELIMEYLYFENKELLANIIKWIKAIFNKFGEETFSDSFNKFIEKFAFIALYKDEEIFEKGIKILCNIEKCRKGSINVIILNILNKLKEKDNNFAMKRASVFVEILCKELNIRHVYLTFADVLSKMNKTDFVCKIINKLNYFLLSSNDAEELRNLLKNVQMTTNEEDKSFFEKLFSTWCINPVSCLILCLIAEDFELSHHLLVKFGEVKIKLNQENYLEYAQLVNVLESKSFLSK